MKKLSYTFVLGLALTSCGFFGVPIDSNPNDKDTVQTPNPAEVNDTARNPQYLYDIEAVPEITIHVTEENWNQYLKNFDENANNDKYVLAAFTFKKGDEVFYRDSVGLRPRGNTSRRRPEGNGGEMHQRDNADWHHAHFGIKFTEYVTGQRFFGSDRIVLKWFKDDAAYVREVYCYDLFRRFGVWSAPRSSYCKLYLHVEGDKTPAYFGVYELLEGVRKGYLADRRKDGFIPDDNGNLWKASWNATLSDPNKGLMGIAKDGQNIPYDLKTNKTALGAAQTQLANFISGMTPLKSGSEQLKNWLLEHMDVDLFLRAQAVNVVVGMWDDYWINSNNYYFYFDSNGKFYFIPYDYDNTLGTSNGINPGTQDPLNWGSRGGDRMLIRKVLSIKEFEDRYKAYLHELAAGDFAYEASKERIQKWHKMIQADIPNDTGEDMEIRDVPGSWGIYHKYRLLSGSVGDGQNKETNYFLTKINSLPK